MNGTYKEGGFVEFLKIFLHLVSVLKMLCSDDSKFLLYSNVDIIKVRFSPLSSQLLI